MTEYKARNGAKFTNKEAQVIGETLETLKDSDGHILTRNVLESAKSEESPLHKHFEWDQTEAAQQFNLHQARSLLNSIVEIVVVAEEPVEQRSFLSVSIPNKGMVYVNLQDAVGQKDYRKQLMEKAIQISKNLTVTLQMFSEHE